MITWSDFVRLFSDEPSGSSVSEMFEFLKSQDQDTLPHELQDLLKWHDNKLKSDVSFCKSIQVSTRWNYDILLIIGFNKTCCAAKQIVVFEDFRLFSADDSQNVRIVLCWHLGWRPSNCEPLQQLSQRPLRCFCWNHCGVFLYYCNLHQVCWKFALV